MKVITRVRWSSEERAAVIRRAQSLMAESPRLPSKALFMASQECLPAERHRPSNTAAVAWLQAEIRRAGPLPSPAEVWRPEQSETVIAGAEPAAVAKQQDTPADVVPAAPSLEALLIETGVRVLTGILSDARVRAAVGALIAGSLPDRPVIAPDPAAAPEPRSRQVVVAGCSSNEARLLADRLEGSLEVLFWTPEQSREELVDLLPTAGLVVGVSSGLPQAVESSLARLGDRFVLHTGGASALYRRLAEHALGAS